jgi:hypothetical protein
MDVLQWLSTPKRVCFESPLLQRRLSSLQARNLQEYKVFEVIKAAYASIFFWTRVNRLNWKGGYETCNSSLAPNCEWWGCRAVCRQKDTDTGYVNFWLRMRTVRTFKCHIHADRKRVRPNLLSILCILDQSIERSKRQMLWGNLKRLISKLIKTSIHSFFHLYFYCCAIFGCPKVPYALKSLVIIEVLPSNLQNLKDQIGNWLLS